MQLVRGTLSPDDAASLLATIAADPPVAQVSSLAQTRTELDRLGTDIAATIPGGEFLTPQPQAPEAENPAAADVEQQTAALTALLSAQLADAQPVDATQIAALTDHWWVQYKSGESWVDLDPSLRDAAPGQAMTEVVDVVAIDPTEPAEDAIGADDLHSFTFNLVVEQLAGGTLSTQTALSVNIVPARTFNAPIDLFIQPGTLPSDVPTSGGDLVAAYTSNALSQHDWTPVLLVGTQVAPGTRFDDSGSIGEAPAASGGAIGGGLGAIGGALGGIGGSEPEAPPPGELTAVWVEYVFHQPGQDDETILRPIFDLIGPAARAANATGDTTLSGWQITDSERQERMLALTETIEIVPQVSAEDPFYSAAMVVQGFKSEFEALAAGEAGAADAAWSAIPGLAELLAVRRREWSPDADRTFVDRINLLSAHYRFGVDDAGAQLSKSYTDIVSNGVAPMPGVVDSVQMRLAQGIADTNAEAALQAGPRSGNAARSFAADLADGVPWRVVASPADLDTLRLSPDLHVRIAAALAKGYIAVLPRGAGPEDSVWWRVNPASGETLGIGQLGWGAAAEYAELQPWQVWVFLGTFAYEVVALVRLIWNFRCQAAGGLLFLTAFCGQSETATGAAPAGQAPANPDHVGSSAPSVDPTTDYISPYDEDYWNYWTESWYEYWYKDRR